MYIDVYEDSKTETLHVVERVNGQRVYKTYPFDHTFYIRDQRGSYKDIFGDYFKKVTPKNAVEKKSMLNMMRIKDTAEADMRQGHRCLETYYHYNTTDAPKLQVAFFDIETDFNKEFGYSPPEEANNEITAIAIYLQWLKRVVCFAVPPKTVPYDRAVEIADSIGNTLICKTEGELLTNFMSIIDDADVISGWNSESFDITYIVNRVMKVLGKHEARKLCLWDLPPKKRIIEKAGGEVLTYDLFGRLHLDYLQLYKKFNYEERQSYALNSIAEIELNENKVEYEGTLDQLYNYDFKKFIEYNIQDTMLLGRLDEKLQFIDLANNIAHSNCVPIQAVMGAVLTTEQAIICQAHEMGLLVPTRDRNAKVTDDRAAGGWVAKPKQGIHEWIGSTDLNSLYPSVIRALNMSPETIVGQIRTNYTDKEINDWCAQGAKYTFAGWWNDRFNTLEMDNFLSNDVCTPMYLDFENGETIETTGADIRNLIFNNSDNLHISANGTIFRSDVIGVIPTLLSRWYSERKTMQAINSSYETLSDAVISEKAVYLPKEIFDTKDIDDSVPRINPYNIDTAFSLKSFNKIIEDGNRDEIVNYMNGHRLTVTSSGMVIARNQDENSEINSFWDKRQLVKKINLNSLYGGLLNVHCRFFDQRLGQSTTLTGRSITRHMAAKTNELITGIYDHTGQCVIYGDTDSCYFTAYPALKDEILKGQVKWSKEIIVKLYDEIGTQVSDTFPEFLNTTFNVPVHMSTGVIKAGREVVGRSGLFIKKKRYAVMVYDKENKRLDTDGKPGKIKAMGLDLKRADTPKFVQKFLMDVLDLVLTGHSEEEVIEHIRQFKTEFSKRKSWEKGTPKSVNGIARYHDLKEDHLAKLLSGESTGRLAIPGHVSASMNWNLMREIHRDLHSQKILNGHKVVVCNLKITSQNKYDSIAYPVDQQKLPEWFTSLPFDDDVMMEKVIDQKVSNLLGVLKWDLNRTSVSAEIFESLFGF